MRKVGYRFPAMRLSAGLLLSLCALLSVSALLSGCSVFMAASSSKDLDLGTIHIGRTTRPQVEQLLGKPISFNRRNYGDEAVYQYFTGDEASPRPRSALCGARCSHAWIGGDRHCGQSSTFKAIDM